MKKIPMKPTQILPDNYRSIGSFDLRNNPQKLLQLNILGFVLFAASAWLFSALLFLLRPDEARIGLVLGFFDLGGIVQAILAVVAVTVAMIVLHEAVHGVGFWYFTRTMPKFAFKGVYAYAAAPDWFLPRGQYLLVALAPLVVLSLLGAALMLVVPPSGFIMLLLFLVSNASGAVGDLWVAAWLLRQPATCYANDRGDAVTLYLEDKAK
jgi:hypothetical protein